MQAVSGGSPAVISLVSKLVVAYVATNRLPASELPGLIASLYARIDPLLQGETVTEESEAKPGPATAAEIQKSVTPDALLSFIDGVPYQMLKRHLKAHGLTPATYRARYGLPDDYPMTAPSYSERRSAIARGIGFGNYANRARKARS